MEVLLLVALLIAAGILIGIVLPKRRSQTMKRQASALGFAYSATGKPFAGTRVDTTWTFDNSAENPRNPNSPPKRVKWGLGTLDEMGSMTLLVTTSSRQDDGQLRRASTQHFRQQLAAMFLGRR